MTGRSDTAGWIPVCRLEDIVPNTGVCALVGGAQVAVFRVGERVYAIGNRDPFSGMGILSRGIVGDRDGVLKVASPLYKQSFALETGACLDDPAVRVPVYPCRVTDGVVEATRSSAALTSSETARSRARRRRRRRR
jgi:nitrite reductase (NADH) small subunit